MIHRLRRRELCDRRQHAEGVGGEHHHVLRLRRAAGARGVRDEVERVRGTRVLGLGAVVEIDHAGVFVEHAVLEHRAEARACGIDLRLGLLRQLDALGIAAALEIEDAVRAPAVLVVADQRAVGIGRQRGLAGARQPEEDRGVALGADIGRAVHRHHAALGQIVVQRGEHRLLHLAGIIRPADQDDLAGEIDRDHVLRAHAVAFRIGAEARHVDDGELRHEGRQLDRLRTDQERADEQRVPGELGEHARLDPVGRVGAAIEVLREQLPAFGVLEEVLVERLELLCGDRLVAGPPHLLVGGGVAYRELVLRAAPGELARVGAECAVGGQHCLTRRERVLIELRRTEVPVNLLEIL